MTFSNSSQAAAAYAEKARALGTLFAEADDGNGGLDLMKVSNLSGDVMARQEELARLGAELQAIGRERVSLQDLEGTREQSRLAVEEASRVMGRPGQPRGERTPRRTIGEQFVQAESWRQYLGNMASAGGSIMEKTPINSPRVPLPGGSLMRGPRAAVIVEGDPLSGGAFLVPQQTGITVPLPMRERTLLDLITMGQTDSESVQYVRITALDNNAAGVAESNTTATPGSPSPATGVKPESEMEFEKVTANVQNIAHGIPISTRMLSDVAQMRTMVDTFLRDGVQEEVERQVLLGTGTGEEIEGIDPVHTLNQAYSAVLTADLSPLLETTRKALTKVQLARGVRPNAFLFHPNDWEDIDLARMAKNPQNEAVGAGMRTLHGVPVVLNEVVTEGFAWVGDFTYYVLWVREQPSIQVSNSHADFFMRNLVMVLGEERVAGGLLRTDAACKIDLTAL